MVTPSLFITIFFATLVSGWHCALMCGGIAAAVDSGFGVNSSIKTNTYPLIRVSRWNLFSKQLIMHLGRLTTYVLLGSLAGLLGFPLWQQSFLPIQRVLFILAACIFLMQGIHLLRMKKAKNTFFEVWLNQKTAHLWVKISKKLASDNQNSARWLGGMLWGLVPCGLIYSVLPLAFLSGDPLSGGVLMFAFGLGTLPNLLLISGFSGYMASLSHSRWTRYLAAVLMFLTGLYGLYRAFTLSETLLKGGFCIASTLNYNNYLVG